MEALDYGAFIATHRKKSGYKSQRLLAEKTNNRVSSATISRIEANKQRPQPDTLRILSEFLITTNYQELLTVSGYLSDSQSNKDLDDENSSSFFAEKEFVDKINLSDEELLKQFKVVVDGRELTDQEMRNMIAFVRTLRQNS